MRIKLFTFAVLVAILMWANGNASAGSPVGNGFTYQGHLSQNGAAFDGSVDLIFRLYDDPIAGNQVGGTVSHINELIDDGLINVELDFSLNAFDGNERWLEIIVDGQTMSPRQLIRPAPMALFALNGGDGGGVWEVSGSNAYYVSGNIGIGTSTPTAPLHVVKASIGDAVLLPGLRLITTTEAPNVVAGESTNDVAVNATGATIGGGSYNQALAKFATISGGGPFDPDNNPSGTSNYVFDIYGTIGGGSWNKAGLDDGDPQGSWLATVAGGGLNRAAGPASTVGGGSENAAEGGASVVSGGGGNIASGEYSSVGGGFDNGATGDQSIVGGGFINLAAGSFSTVCGGFDNQALSDYSTVLGGLRNEASGVASLAAGEDATSLGSNTFVWNDGTSPLTETVGHRVTMRASGGYKLFTGASSFAWLPPGSSDWAVSSDRHAKHNIVPIAPQEILLRVVHLPLHEWSYKAEGDVRHVGPMAQDFYAAFGLGSSEKHITGVDANGVALAAIQGLYAQLESIRARNDELQRVNDQLCARLDRLEQLIQKFERSK